jgi:biotin carboxyl carrier protein
MKYIVTVEGREFGVEILEEGQITLDGVNYQIDVNAVPGQPVYSLLVDRKSFEAYVFPNQGGYDVLLRGTLYPVTVENERERRLRTAIGGSPAESAEFFLKAPMPGLVVAVPVVEGQSVEKGDVLVILESMKMQNELKAPKEGTVTRLRIAAGDNVEQKQTLLSVV